MIVDEVEEVEEDGRGEKGEDEEGTEGKGESFFDHMTFYRIFWLSLRAWRRAVRDRKRKSMCLNGPYANILL